MMQKPSNLLVRIPKGGLSLETIVARHNAVVSLHGTVCFGVNGTMLSSARCALLFEQPRTDDPAHLYVVQRRDQEFQGFCARLRAISRTAPNSPRLIPAYYFESGFARKVHFWVKVEKFMEADSQTIRSFQIQSTGKPLIEVLTDSMASVMIVC